MPIKRKCHDMQEHVLRIYVCRELYVRKVVCYCNNSPKYRVFPNIDNTKYEGK